MSDDMQTTLVRAQLRDLHGDAFQSRFAAFMENHHGSDFVRARACGLSGDQGYDSYLRATGEVFACYGVLGGRAAVMAQCEKIRSDFAKAKVAANAPPMARWTFVHNLVDGLAPQAVAEIARLQRENPEIPIRPFGLPEFLEIWPRDALHTPRLQRPVGRLQPPRDDREWMDPRYPHIPLTGRDEMLQELRTWLQGADISVRVLTAVGGSGKTRLAWELCREAETDGWDAGFLKQDALRQWLSHPDPSAWCWYQPTLLVIDYAAFVAGELRTWFLHLAEPRAQAFALRILLLERHGQPGEGWWEAVFNAPGSEGDNRAVQRLLDPPAPVPLPGLTQLAWRRAVLAAVLEARGAGIALPDDPPFNQQLETLSWGGEPLFLILAALLAAERGFFAMLSFNGTGLVMDLAKRELTRLRGFADGRARGAILCRLAGCATLAGGLTRQQAMALADEEKRERGDPNAGESGEFAERLHHALPGSGGAIAPILPDLLGEAVILTLFQEEDYPTVARTFDLAPNQTAEFLVHCVQDYSDPAHPEQHPQPIQWLAQLIRRPALSLEQAMAIARSMPLTTIALKQLAVEVSQGIVNRLKEEGQQGQRATPDPLLAAGLHNLGLALAEFGRREEALAATEESVALRWQLSARHPDAYMPDLAGSLNNLGNWLDALGRREEALAVTEESVALRRQLSARHPDAHMPDLAISLNNLGIRLNVHGRRQEALAATEEAVAIRRQLSARDPDAYMPDLASSLNNLGNWLDDLGRWEEALAATKEAVAFYRQLAERNPDAYRPNLAISINNLGNRLDVLGRREHALTVAEEAVALSRQLSARDPDAYMPGLAGSLHNLGNRLAVLGRREDSLAAAEEAVALRRHLAARHPDAYRPDLALSLNALSNRLHGLEQHKEAHSVAMEAVEILSPYFLAFPQAYTHWMGGIVQNYGDRCRDAGVEPNQALLEPILRVLPTIDQGMGSSRSTELSTAHHQDSLAFSAYSGAERVDREPAEQGIETHSFDDRHSVGSRFHALAVHNAGPVFESVATFGERLTLITGDNGLGKSFLLDLVWWVLTRQWPGEINKKMVAGKQVVPADPEQPASIRATLRSAQGDERMHLHTFNRREREWVKQGEHPPPACLVLYSMADGSLALWDPARNGWNADSHNDPESIPAYVFTQLEIWDGLEGGQGAIPLCNGLIRDVAGWQKEKGEVFELLKKVLSALMPDAEPMQWGELTRVSRHDARDVPTLQMTYGHKVPLLYASSGIRRILAMAYLLIWAWEEHGKASDLMGEPRVAHIIFLVDELEAHLHPRWQFTILGALLTVMEHIAPAVSIQLITTTHSPQVMASAETVYDQEKDQWLDLDFDVENQRVLLMPRPFEPWGEVSAWLTSAAFDLSSDRNPAIAALLQEAAALAYQSPDTGKIEEMNRKLCASLNELDPFLVRWRAMGDRKGWWS